VAIELRYDYERLFLVKVSFIFISRGPNPRLVPNQEVCSAKLGVSRSVMRNVLALVAQLALHFQHIVVERFTYNLPIAPNHDSDSWNSEGAARCWQSWIIRGMGTCRHPFD